MGPGPRAWAPKGLGPGGRGHYFFFKGILAPPCVLCRGIVLCAGVKVLCAGVKVLCAGVKVLSAGVKVLCARAKSYVQGQTLVTLFFYGVDALWRERSVT